MRQTLPIVAAKSNHQRRKSIRSIDDLDGREDEDDLNANPGCVIYREANS